MGTYASSFNPTPEQSTNNLNPNQGQWITGHADQTGCKFILSCKLLN